MINDISYIHMYVHTVRTYVRTYVRTCMKMSPLSQSCTRLQKVLYGFN